MKYTDSLKHTLPYYFYLIERFLKLSSNFVWGALDMFCDVNIMGFVCVSFVNRNRFTVPHESLCPGLPYFKK